MHELVGWLLALITKAEVYRQNKIYIATVLQNSIHIINIALS